MSKKKPTKKTTKPTSPSKKRTPVLPILGMLIALVGLVFGLCNWLGNDTPTDGGLGVATGNFQPLNTSPNADITDLEDLDSEAYKSLQVVQVGNYSGLFMEDGSNDIVSRVLMVVVKNTGNRTVQYGQVELTDGKITATFALSTLPPGESVVLLEKNRMSYDAGKDLSEVTIKNVAVFQQEPSRLEDELKIQALDGILNVSNISGTDITGDIVIYYKNASSDMLYGGITYRVTIKGGIKDGEVRQITAAHFTAKGSRVMWISVS